jgi:hypothetical protein
MNRKFCFFFYKLKKELLTFLKLFYGYHTNIVFFFNNVGYPRTSKVGPRARTRFLTFKVQCLGYRNLPPTKAFSYLVSQLGI